MSKDNSGMAERPAITKSAQQPAKKSQNGRGSSAPSKAAVDMMRLHDAMRHRQAAHLPEIAEDLGMDIDACLELAQACPTINARHSISGWSLRLVARDITVDQANDACDRIASRHDDAGFITVAEAERLAGRDALERALNGGMIQTRVLAGRIAVRQADIEDVIKGG
jgi:hypothetical protein